MIGFDPEDINVWEEDIQGFKLSVCDGEIEVHGDGGGKRERVAWPRVDMVSP